MKMDELLCWNCRKQVPYTIHSRKRVRQIGDREYEYREKYGECDLCHEEITVPGLDDENERVLDNIFRADNDLISIEEINEILHKYNIEKRPLSHVLGMGEHTISRYIEGAMPNKRYSDFLRNILRYHTLMRDYLEKNKADITETAYVKADHAISEMERMSSYESKIELIALYIIHRGYEVTDLSLQKLLYYVKAFSWIIAKRDAFPDECEAWAYGPVFPVVYEKYKSLGSSVIADYDRTIPYDELLSVEERKVLDYVIDCFGIYNGSVLMRLTHKEKPWQDARGGIPEFAPSNNIIENASIREYFETINKKYHIKKPEGVKAYIYDLGVI